MPSGPRRGIKASFAAEEGAPFSLYAYGPDAGVYRLAVDQLRRRLAAQGRGVATQRLAGPQAWGEAAVAARTRSLWAEARLVVAEPEGAPSVEVAQVLARALAQPAPGVALVVREPAFRGPPPAAVRTLREGPWAVRAERPSPAQARELLSREAKERGLLVTAPALEELLERCGLHAADRDDERQALAVALGELDKYQAIWPPGAPVDVDAVRELTPDRRAAQVFAVGEAYLAGDTGKALRAVAAALEKGASPFALTGVLGRQARLALAARAYLAQHPRAGTAELASHLGIPPWQARPLAHAAQHAHLPLERAPMALAQAESELRGSVGARTALVRLVLRLMGEVPTPWATSWD
jgi:DNA polymerase-3 subunit delta